jgi:type II secretory pathway component GspD/PulD (secretin)
MNYYKQFFLILGILIVSSPIFGQRIKSMDFRNQDITDILMVLAETSGTSIIADETVEGKASFHFTDSDFEEALGTFLRSFNLFYKKDGGVFRVSRISSSYDKDGGLVTLRANDTDIEILIKNLARTLNTTILFDPLPRTMISADIDRLTVRQALDILVQRLPEYTLEEKNSFYYIRQQNTVSTGERITREEDAYSLNTDSVRFLEILPELFRKAEKEYVLLTRTDGVLEHLHYTNKDFDTLLKILLDLGNADSVIQNGIYYIIELQRRDIVRKFRETRIIPLSHLNAQELPGIFPAELGTGNAVKIDKSTNAVILTGTAEEINPIAAFIERADQPNGGPEYRRFEMKYLTAADAVQIIPQRLIPQAPLIVPGSNAIMVPGSPEGLNALEQYLALIDRKDEGYPVRLKYIKTEELLKTLPPSVYKEDITDSGFPNLIFFTGGKEKRELFLKELALMDQPKPQIRYELLVIEYMKNKEAKTSRSLSITPAEEAARGMAFLGSLSNVMNLSFDVVAQFGYQFAANLSLQLGNNTAQVYANTTLNGLTGQEIKFQNTDTYRYQEFEADADTGNITRTGVTREISSGLIVSLTGWVSGHDMITISINATVSKQNNHVPEDNSGIPSTSERVVHTQIRTPSGKPIVLSGLIKEDSNKNIKKLPFLGDIPLLGRLFKDQSDTREKTEIVIYVVPYLSGDGEAGEDDAVRIERYYQTFIQGNHK